MAQLIELQEITITSVGQASMQSSGLPPHGILQWDSQAGMGVVDSGVGGNNYNTYIGANSRMVSNWSVRGRHLQYCSRIFSSMFYTSSWVLHYMQ